MSLSRCGSWPKLSLQHMEINTIRPPYVCIILGLPGVCIPGLCYADDTTLLADPESKLQRLLA